MSPKEFEVKHLELIQSVVNRMAGNSFLLKGWTVTLVAALFALAAQDTNVQYSTLTLFPALAFWGLDAYYLRLERLYRKLYDDVCQALDEDRPFQCFSLDTRPYETQVAPWHMTLISHTVWPIHGLTTALVAYLIW